MSLLEHFQSIADPRVSHTRRHDLQALLAIALCATLAGADNWVEVAEFGQVHQNWFAQFVGLPSGVASHDTFAWVFRLLDAEQLQAACQEWLTHMAGQVQGVVAIDGKTVRGARKAKRAGPCTWSAPGRQTWGCCWASARSMARAMKSSPFPSCCKCCT